MKRTPLLGLLAASTIVLTAACGGSSGSGAGSKGTTASTPAAATEAAPAKKAGGLSLDAVRNDPCQRVTTAEAEAILGARTAAPQKMRAVGAFEAGCHYSVDTTGMRGAEANKAPTGSVGLMFSPERVKGSINGKKYMENAKSGVTTVPVPGLGDEAFCVQDDAPQIFARSSDIVLNSLSTDCARAAQFLTKALARL